MRSYAVGKIHQDTDGRIISVVRNYIDIGTLIVPGFRYTNVHVWRIDEKIFSIMRT